MHKIWKAFAVLVLASLGTGIASASTLTYTFTGVVTAAEGAFATFDGVSVIGDAVTGTYIFNYGAAIPSQSSGTPGSSAWSSVSDFPGTFPSGGSLSALLVFTSTAQVVGTNISYATFPPSTGYDIGSNAGGNNGNLFQATEIANQAGGGTQSTFETDAYDSNGGPVYPTSSPAGSAFGHFAVTTPASSTMNVLAYDITSISPPSAVPLPASAWLMLSGVIGLGAMARKRRTA
jgi:hypothetical protein